MTPLSILLCVTLIVVSAAAMYAAYRASKERKEACARAVNAALEEAASICDGLAKLYKREDIGFDTGYRMGCERAAREIRVMRTPTPNEQSS